MNKKIILITIGLMVVVVVFVLLVILRFLIGENRNNSNNGGSSNPLITPTASPSDGNLEILNILPGQNMSMTYLPFQKITLEFNEPVSPGGLFIEVEPQVELDVFQGASPNQLFIIPRSMWVNGLTTITVLKSTYSISGENLSEEFEYIIQTAVPTLSPEEIEDIHP